MQLSYLVKPSQVAQLISFRRQCKTDMSYSEFHKVLQEVGNIAKANLKPRQIRSQKNREELLKQIRKEGDVNFS